ncbi:cadherin EGF LAG seven-pass G-type receptor 3-like [Schistocerca piceifrons]|uniref:cadherin EGF LAG seven-pass G-type receptor 3-like n=1 Tax=Schistocerca piceifrons TaxID=274613 RepID=UPI001F5FE2D1|nr:cadherin EGF LAG seven-pass G-type receptor 3-like [Schistocerca piceifrons]
MLQQKWLCGVPADLSSVEPGVIPVPSTLDDDDDDVDNEVPGVRGQAVRPSLAAGGGAGAAAAAAGAGATRREWRPGAPDPDLHDHDVIDSVMYIYFGQQRQLQLEREQRTRTSWRRPHSLQVLVAGTVAAMVAQVLTLLAAARRLRERPRDCSAAILLNTEAALATASLVFLSGVQATRSRQLCEAVSLLLHYVHLAAACWLFTISVHVLHRLRSRCRQLLSLACPLAWLLPALVVLGCYLFNPHSYETRRFCWMSVERGMMFSYLVPVASLIFANTVVTVACVRELARRELLEKAAPCADECWCGEGGEPADSALCLAGGADEPEGGGPQLGQRVLRRCAWLLPLFAVAWFLSVVALENPHALTLSFLHGLTTGILVSPTSRAIVLLN